MFDCECASCRAGEYLGERVVGERVAVPVYIFRGRRTVICGVETAGHVRHDVIVLDPPGLICAPDSE